MIYPLYFLSHKDVEQMVELGAVTCMHLVIDEYDQRTRKIKATNWIDLVHFFNAEGAEIGYCNTFGMPPHIFDNPRVWGQEHLDAHAHYNMKTGEKTCPVKDRQTQQP